MSSLIKPLTLIAAATALFAIPAMSQPYHHRHHAYRYGPAQPDGSGEPNAFRNASYPQAYGGYYGAPNRSYGTSPYGQNYATGFGYAGGWEAASIAGLTAQAYREPGLTLELFPDAKLTATGGPAGGLPYSK